MLKIKTKMHCEIKKNTLLLQNCLIKTKVIGPTYFWTMWRVRNGKVFNGEMAREKQIFENI